MHSGKKPFACDIRDKAFNHKPVLTRHRKYHLEIKPFRSDVCHNEFIQKSDIFKHLKVHSTTPPQHYCD